MLKVRSSLEYSAPMIAAMIERLIRAVGRDPRTVPDIHIEMTPISAAAMPALYRAADCLVAPARAAGWARPVLEAMASGIPVIATATGAHEDLLAEGLAAVVPHADEPVPVAARREEPTAAARWREPDAAALRALMRSALADRRSGRARADGRGRRSSAGTPWTRSPPSFRTRSVRLRVCPGPPPARDGPAEAPGGAQPEQVSFVVQGPVEAAGPAWTARTCAALRAFFPGAEIVLSTWAGTYPKGIAYDALVLSEDPGPVGTNPSNANVNRQLVSTLAGIEASSRPLVVKVRSDLQFHSAALLREWGRRPAAARRCACSTSGYSSPTSSCGARRTSRRSPSTRRTGRAWGPARTSSGCSAPRR